jgi:replicative superfamily II helicase
MRDYGGRLRAMAGDAFAGGRIRWRRQLRSATLLGQLRHADDPVPQYTIEESRLMRANALIRRSELTRTARERRQDPGQLPQAAQTYSDLAMRAPAGSTERAERLALAATTWSLAGYQANSVAQAQQYLAELDPDVGRAPADVQPVAAAAPAAILFIVGAVLARDVHEVGRLGVIAEEAAPQLEVRLLEEVGSETLDVSDVAVLAAYGLLGRVARRLARFWRVGDRTAAERAKDDIATARRILGDTGVVDTWLLVDNLHYVVEDIIATSPWRMLRRAPSWNRQWDRYLRTQAIAEHPVVQVWPSQRQVLDAGLLDRDRPNLTVCMPTSGGKTHTAEWAILDSLTAPRPAEHLPPLAVYVVPTRALAAEIERNLARSLGAVGLRVSGILGGAENVDYELGMVGASDVLVLTAEKFDLLLRNDDSVRERLALLVADEGHMLGAGDRGLRLEMLLTRVKRRIPHARVLLLSAVLPNGEDIASWLDPDGGHLADVPWSPSTLRLGVFSWRGQEEDGQRGFVDYVSEDMDDEFFVPYVLTRRMKVTRAHPQSKTDTAGALAVHYQRLGPVLIIAPKKNMTVTAARAVLTAAKTSEVQLGVGGDGELSAEVGQERERVAQIVTEYAGAEHPLIGMVRAGVGFHHADVPQEVRLALERAYRAGALTILCATTTLAQGVNLPTKTVIVSGTSYDRGQEMPVRDFRNIAGRAGRAFRESEGHAILVAADLKEARKLQKRYIDNPVLEPVQSQLGQLYVDLLRARLSTYKVLHLAVPDTLDLNEPTAATASAAATVDLQLMALLAEEVVETDDEVLLTDAVEAVLGDTLAARQLGAHNMNLRPLARFASTRLRRLRDRVPDPARRAAFLRTGLSIDGCEDAHTGARAIADAIATDPGLLSDERWPELRALLLAAAVEVSEVKASAAKSKVPADVLPALAADWMSGRSMDDLRSTYGEAVGSPDALAFVQLLDRVVVNDMAWVLSAVVLLLELELDLILELPLAATSISAMAKYGVDTPTACFAASLGVKNRQDARTLGSMFPTDFGVGFQEFVGWVSMLPHWSLTSSVSTETAAMFLDRAAALSTPRDLLDIAVTEEGSITVPLRGARAMGTADTVIGIAIGEELELELEREHQNAADRNAIAVKAAGQRVGYLAREHARVLAPLMDLEDGPRIGAVLAVRPRSAPTREQVEAQDAVLVRVSVAPAD